MYTTYSKMVLKKYVCIYAYICTCAHTHTQNGQGKGNAAAQIKNPFLRGRVLKGKCSSYKNVKTDGN